MQHRVLLVAALAVVGCRGPNAVSGMPGPSATSAGTLTQLWTLHAWIWRGNPDGIFNPTNPRLP